MNAGVRRLVRIACFAAGALPLLMIAHRALGDGKGDAIHDNAEQMLAGGRNTFRYDTFGDEAFWGDALKLHQAIEGSAHGGQGAGVSPRTALAVGVKIDADALPEALVQQVQKGAVDLNDPATTLALLQLNSVVGVTGFFNPDGSLKSIGIQCALCHSTVDNSFSAPGIPAGNVGHRLDGWPNRDLNVGAIVNLAPDLSAPDKVLGVDDATLRKVLLSWGPGKFDAEVFMDGKGFRPGRRVGRDADPARVWACGLQPAHLDRLGFSALLERARRQPGDARQGAVLRSAAQQSEPISHRRKEWIFRCTG